MEGRIKIQLMALEWRNSPKKDELASGRIRLKPGKYHRHGDMGRETKEEGGGVMGN